MIGKSFMYPVSCPRPLYKFLFGGGARFLFAGFVSAVISGLTMASGGAIKTLVHPRFY